jgi:hypothetical protein
MLPVGVDGEDVNWRDRSEGDASELTGRRSRSCGSEASEGSGDDGFGIHFNGCCEGVWTWNLEVDFESCDYCA